MSKMTMAAVALSLLAIVPAAARQASPPPPEALDGVDVVVLLQQGKEVFGKSAFHSVHGGFDYLFSSAENKAQFDKAPDKYEIQLGGRCARMGGMVTGNPSDYVVHDGKIYIFGSEQCHKLFVATPAKYLPRPAPPMPTSAAAANSGRALLDKAAAAHGGARLDAVSSYAESWTGTQQRQTGPVSIPNKMIWRFPGEARSERTIPLAKGPMTFVTLLTPAGAWGGTATEMTAPPPGVLPAVQRTFWRQLIPLLRVRRDAQVKAAALDPATVGGVQLDRVRVVNGHVDVTLNIERATGRVRSMSYVDRKGDGEIGDITIAFSDYKPVEGVLVPFAETGTFNGAANPTLTRQLDSATVNAPVDPQLFAPPAGAAK